MKTLCVTSPYTRNADVKIAQTTLKRNVFKTNFLKVDNGIDGVFGEITGRGCVRAKYWLGYDSGSQLPIYGDLLHSYLTGKQKLPERMRKVRAARIAAAASAPKPLGVKALENLQRFLGTTEEPASSNRHPISSWYGVTGPWCAMAVTYGMVAAGSKAFQKGGRYAFVPYMIMDARAGRNGLQLVRFKDALAGDIVCFDWQAGGPLASPYSFDHTGLLRAKVREDGSFLTREGNTSPSWGGSQSNGGGLYDRERDLDRATCLFLRAGR